MRVPGNFAFNPYGDFLVHDMGTLGDRIGDAGNSVAVTRRMRTQPLWGVSRTFPFLHDGRAQTLHEAISLHGGEAELIRDAFLALTPSEQADVISFLEHL